MLAKKIIESQMLQLFLVPYIPVRNLKKSFALTSKHLFSAINIIIKQLHYLRQEIPSTLLFIKNLNKMY
jgi:hypothetical protein